MIEDDEKTGLWWPVEKVAGVAYRPTRLKNGRIVADFVRQHVPIRRQVVQAGGHVGIWPKHLALLFEQVYTFEPNADNFAALMHNVIEPNVFAARGVLGMYHRLVRMSNAKGETGTHFVSTNANGTVPTYKVDDLGLHQLDLLMLDVEGFELPALLGAEETVRRCWPAVILEVGGWNSEHNFGNAVEWLRSMGYRHEEPVQGKDVFFLRSRE